MRATIRPIWSCIGAIWWHVEVGRNLAFIYWILLQGKLIFTIIININLITLSFTTDRYLFWPAMFTPKQLFLNFSNVTLEWTMPIDWLEIVVLQNEN